MRDIDFYEQILGLKGPWRVDQVELSVDEKRVDIRWRMKQG